LVFNTPFDTHSDVFHANLFDITNLNGEAPIYSGIIIKRRPTVADFVTLRPGQTIETVLNLHKGYNFPLAGEYKVTLNTNSWIFQGEVDVSDAREALASFSRVTFSSNYAVVKVATASAPLVWPEFNSTLLGNAAPKQNCNTYPVSQITTASANAVTASKQGYDYLSGVCTAAKTYYTTWFGVCDNTRYSTTRNNLAAINSGLIASYPVDCQGNSCTANTYAYVFPADGTHTIYVCGVYWKVTTANCVMDSQPGTLIHEMGHFNNVAALKDVEYGIEPCKTLAKNYPNSAVTNADNYCFYTDSCPR